MAYDEELADRIREQIGDEQNLTEKKMFGGLAFLVGGNMAIAASGQGGLLVRVDPEESEMKGWLRVASEHVGTKDQLAEWVERGTSYARSLPPK